MRFITLAVLLFSVMFVWSSVALAADPAMVARLSGKILLQVEQHGEAWYVRPSDGLRYYMPDGDSAYQMMRTFGLGITDADLATIPQVATTDEMLASESACGNPLAARLRGEILLQVESHGEAYYVEPDRCRAIYLADGAAAYQIMRYLGLGVTDADLALLDVGLVGEALAPGEGSEEVAMSAPDETEPTDDYVPTPEIPWTWDLYGPTDLTAGTHTVWITAPAHVETELYLYEAETESRVLLMDSFFGNGSAGVTLAEDGQLTVGINSTGAWTILVE